MPNWTSLATVQKHIQSVDIPSAVIENERHELIGTTAEQLEHTSVDTDSEDVKQIQISAPHTDTGNPITLNDTTLANLQKSEIVRDTVVVASNAALTTVFIESKDFIIDYDLGKIRRTTNSAIANGGTVHVFYLFFTKFTKSTDYTIDDDNGRITRITLGGGGSIEDGATVYVDYSHSQATVTDDIINQAILEAEAWMEERLKDTFTTASTDQGLESAATYFSLVIIGLSQSFKEMQLGRDDSDTLAKRWVELATRYDETGVLYFQKFSRGVTRNTGGLMQNRNKGVNYQPQIQSPPVTARRRKR